VCAATVTPPRPSRTPRVQAYSEKYCNHTSIIIRCVCGKTPSPLTADAPSSSVIARRGITNRHSHAVAPVRPSPFLTVSTTETHSRF